jgi:aspartate carbamoyltransferase catalytic subunit
MGEIHVMREGFLPPKPPPRRHLISIGDLERDDVERLLATAGSFSRSLEREVKKLPTLRGFTVVNVFYESSTRTSSSFELAAKRLSADTMSIKAAGSSVDKGESLKDTALTLGAYDPDVIVLRHPQIGAPQLVSRYTDAHIVNAGDGKHQHPTQALLDLYTIKEELGRLEDVHVAIVGDVLHSRVARSLIHALTTLGTPDVRVIGPRTLMPTGVEQLGVSVHHDMREGLAGCDVVMMLRLQNERMKGPLLPSSQEFFKSYGLTPQKLALAKPDAIVMHPGPMNRGVEIDSSVADGAHSVILPQVTFGIAVRMAVMSILAGN